jgi:methanogenic corrinoid protein MtbC1
VANLPNQELEKIASDMEIANELAPESATQETLSHNYLETCLNDILMLDPRPFERHLQQALVEMGLISFLRDLIHPLLFKVGSLWEKGNIRTCQEHFASAGLRSFLGRYLVDTNIDDQGPRIIIATPPNHSHELGATIAGVIAATRGWQVVYLGPFVPVEELIFAADCKAAKAVALSLSFPVLDPSIPDYLTQLRQALPDSTSILVGGASYSTYSDTLEAIKAECSETLDDFIATLDKLHAL